MDRQNWFRLADREARRLLASKGVWLVGATILIDGFISIPSGPTAVRYLGNLRFVAAFQRGISLVGALGCIVFGAQAVARARREGYLTTTVLQPISRFEILVGKAVGRTVAVSVPVVAAVLAGVGIGVLDGVFPPLVGVVAFICATVLYLFAITTAMVGFSTLVEHVAVAAAPGFVSGAFLLVFYEESVNKVLELLYGTSKIAPGSEHAGIAFLLQRANPLQAFLVLSNWALGLPNSATYHQILLAELEPESTVLGVKLLSAVYVERAAPWYLHEAISIPILLAFGAVPFAIASKHFDTIDIR